MLLNDLVNHLLLVIWLWAVSLARCKVGVHDWWLCKTYKWIDQLIRRGPTPNENLALFSKAAILFNRCGRGSARLGKPLAHPTQLESLAPAVCRMLCLEVVA